jgi:hypothetical protein
LERRNVVAERVERGHSREFIFPGGKEEMNIVMTQLEWLAHWIG